MSAHIGPSVLPHGLSHTGQEHSPWADVQGLSVELANKSDLISWSRGVVQLSGQEKGKTRMGDSVLLHMEGIWGGGWGEWKVPVTHRVHCLTLKNYE
jgi:hypothetical protein